MRRDYLAAALGLILGDDHYLNRPKHTAFQIDPNPQPRPFESLPDDVRAEKKRRDKLTKKRKARSKKKRGY